MANIEKLISEMSAEELQNLSQAIDDEGRARIETERRAKKAISDIEDILDESGFKLRDLFGKQSGPRTRDFPESRHVNHPIGRNKGTDRYRYKGVTYDGRLARRTKVFADFVKDGRIDIDLVVAKGAFNPDWLNEQPNHVLEKLGIYDLEKYKRDFGM